MLPYTSHRERGGEKGAQTREGNWNGGEGEERGRGERERREGGRARRNEDTEVMRVGETMSSPVRHPHCPNESLPTV